MSPPIFYLSALRSCICSIHREAVRCQQGTCLYLPEVLVEWRSPLCQQHKTGA